MEIVSDYFLIGKIDEQIDAGCFLIYFLYEEIEKIYLKVH